MTCHGSTYALLTIILRNSPTSLGLSLVMPLLLLTGIDGGHRSPQSAPAVLHSCHEGIVGCEHQGVVGVLSRLDGVREGMIMNTVNGSAMLTCSHGLLNGI
jgi:hypothetical protein